MLMSMITLTCMSSHHVPKTITDGMLSCDLPTGPQQKKRSARFLRRQIEALHLLPHSGTRFESGSYRTLFTLGNCNGSLSLRVTVASWSADPKEKEKEKGRSTRRSV